MADVTLKRARWHTALLGVAVSAMLSGCAQLSQDGGMQAVEALSGAAIGKDVLAIRGPDDEAHARTRVAALLKSRLSADAAVQVALLNNRELQAAYNALGISEAAFVQATLPPNPTVSVARLAAAGSTELEARIIGAILTLATLPARSDIASDRFRQAQLQAASATLRVATETRRAWYRAVASHVLAGFLADAQTAADSAATLSTRLGETGALNKLDQARNQAFYAELSAQLAQARQRASSERERLIRAMGLWGQDLEFRLAATLPALPRAPRVMPGIEVEAVGRRLDLQIARLEVDALAKSYNLTQATRFLNLLDLAGIDKTTRDGDDKIRERGFEVEFQIPIFDFGAVRARQAEETYMQAINRLVAKAVNVRSEARDAYRSYRALYDIARHYQREVLPLRKIISDETLLRYNAMQIDVFALLIEARQRIAATTAAIEAERDFWLAQSALGAAVIGGGVMNEGDTPVAAMAAGESSSGH
jgi:outer membrane protein TolC